MTKTNNILAAITALAVAALLFTTSCHKEPARPEITPAITVSEPALSFAGDGDTKTLTVTASGKWICGSESGWIKIDPAIGGSATSANSETTVNVTATPNSSKENRTGEIVFCIKGHEDISETVLILQSAAGQADPGTGLEEPDNSSVVIARSEFIDESSWSVTGSIMSLGWTEDLPMLEEPLYGWIAAFDVEVNEGGEFKFRKDADWATNLGAAAGQPGIDKKYTMADDGGNFKLPAGTYDLYIHPSFMLLYVEEAGATFTHGDAVPSSQEGENVRIYLLNNSTWTRPFMYAYASGGAMQPFGGWPGTYANGTKQFGDYTWTYWEASGFSGVGGVSLILNNDGASQYPAKDEKEPLWDNLTVMNTMFFVWDGKKVTQIEDPANPGVTGKGKEPAKMEFGSSAWTLIGTLGGTNWDYDFAMETEGYWEVARDIKISTGEQFKFRQNRKWDFNLGYGEYSETSGHVVNTNTKLALGAGAGNLSVSATGNYDIYLSVGNEDKYAYILPAGTAWTHEADGKPDFFVGGKYSSTIAPASKRSGLTYQVNVFSFKDSNGDGYGDFNGLTRSLDYFDALGVTALWLSPIQPAQSYHGYDVTDYETVNKRYGTEEDFKTLIKEAHKHNIRIYMDYVMNHAGDQSKWFLDIKDNGTKSPYWNYFSLSKDPAADVAAGKIAQIPSYYGYNQYKWYPVTVGGKGQKRYKIDLDWTNASAPKMTVTETTAAVTTGGTHSNPARYLYWGDGTYTQFADAGTNKYTLTLDYDSSWGCLVRTTNTDVWTGKTKWGFNANGDQMKLGVPHTLYSDDNPDKVQTIVMPGGEIYYYYTEFGTGSFVDFNYGPASSCENSEAFKAIMVGVEKWLKMGVDGFRLDAVKHIYADENGPENKTFWAKFYDASNKIYKANAAARSDLAGTGDENNFMVGEVLSDDGACTPFYTGLPALFEFQFWWDLRECLNGETIYAAGYQQTLPSSLSYRWNKHQDVRGNAIATPKLANHDEDRTASSLGNYMPKIRLAGAILLTSAGRPFIYQGEELGYWGTKAGGDEFVRTPILWTKSTGSAASKGVSNKIDWNMLKPSISVESQAEEETSLLTLYRHFGYARSVNPALATGWPEPDGADNCGGKLAGWYLHEQNGSKVVLVLHNLASYGISTKRWPGENVTNDNILVCNGKVTVNGSVSDGATVNLPPYSSVVFELN